MADLSLEEIIKRQSAALGLAAAASGEHNTPPESADVNALYALYSGDSLQEKLKNAEKSMMEIVLRESAILKKWASPSGVKEYKPPPPDTAATKVKLLVTCSCSGEYNVVLSHTATKALAAAKAQRAATVSGEHKTPPELATVKPVVTCISSGENKVLLSQKAAKALAAPKAIKAATSLKAATASGEDKTPPESANVKPLYALYPGDSPQEKLKIMEKNMNGILSRLNEMQISLDEMKKEMQIYE